MACLEEVRAKRARPFALQVFDAAERKEGGQVREGGCKEGGNVGEGGCLARFASRKGKQIRELERKRNESLK